MKSATKVTRGSILECCMCGESLGGHDGNGNCYDLDDGDRICEPCYDVATDLMDLLIPIPDVLPPYHTDRQMLQSRRGRALKALIRVLMRAGHKARVRVRQHEEQKKHLPAVEE